MKRRGFTLIELMVVIAIIIILAAIAIPNYLSMTARAKRSRVASDFAALATALETFRTDWNHYPITTAGGKEYIVTLAAGSVYAELSGTNTPDTNTGTTAGGETAPIAYMTESILKSMINPYSNVDAARYYYTSDTAGKHWLLVSPTEPTGAVANSFLSRTDETTAVTGPSAILALPTG